MSAVVGANIAVETTVVVRLQNIENTGVAVAITMARLGKIPVLKMLYVADMRERDSITMLSDDVCHIVVGVGVQATRTEGEAVVLVVHHLQETVDARLVYQQSRQAEVDYSYRQALFKQMVAQYQRYLNRVLCNIGGIYLNERFEGDAIESYSVVPAAEQKASVAFLLEKCKDMEWIDECSVEKGWPLSTPISHNMGVLLRAEAVPP